MSPDSLDLIWRSADVESPAFTGDEVAAWPQGLFTTLKKAGLLSQGKTATHVTCDACSEGHVEEVMRIPGPGGSVRFFFACPEHGRVEVDRAQLLQWSVRFERLSRILADEMGVPAEPKELIPARLWNIGRVSLAGRSRVVWVGRGLSWPDAGLLSGALPAGKAPVLFILGQRPSEGLVKIPADSMIELAHVLSLADGRFTFDRAAAVEQLSTKGEVVEKRPQRKRAERATAMDSLKKAIREHLRDAYDHAMNDIRNNRPPGLLPRPKQKFLAEQLQLSQSAVCRALRDGYDRELIVLWKAANDIKQVLKCSDL